MIHSHSSENEFRLLSNITHDVHSFDTWLGAGGTRTTHEDNWNVLHLICSSTRLSNQSLPLIQHILRPAGEGKETLLDALTTDSKKTPLHLLCANLQCTRDLIELMVGTQSTSFADQHDRDGMSALKYLCLNNALISDEGPSSQNPLFVRPRSVRRPLLTLQVNPGSLLSLR